MCKTVHFFRELLLVCDAYDAHVEHPRCRVCTQETEHPLNDALHTPLQPRVLFVCAEKLHLDHFPEPHPYPSLLRAEPHGKACTKYESIWKVFWEMIKMKFFSA